MKVTSWSGHTKACGTWWLPAGGPQPRLGCGAQQPSSLSSRWGLCNAGGDRQGRDTVLRENSTEKPFLGTGFFRPPLEAPGSRAAVLFY